MRSNRATTVKTPYSPVSPKMPLKQTAFSRDLETGTYTPLVTGCPAEGGSLCPCRAGTCERPRTARVFGQKGSEGYLGEGCPPCEILWSVL